jgi:hypothetical protein
VVNLRLARLPVVAPAVRAGSAGGTTAAVINPPVPTLNVTSAGTLGRTIRVC